MRRQLTIVMILIVVGVAYLWANADPDRYYAFSNSKQPTLRELKIFLSQDDTDKNPYIDGKYVCRHFTFDIIEQAKKYHYRVGYVMLANIDGGHAIACFDTPSGIYYVEPQWDVIINQQQMNNMISNGVYNISLYNDFCIENFNVTISFCLIWWM